mmetsp:Transcript_9806/g.19062  ORF Transcript_9806/g.19062 Transcript_9806/m.19062 type:complete len:307 (+) Transcript_9806:290-1210(+)
MQHLSDESCYPDQMALSDLRIMQRNNPQPSEAAGWYLHCRKRLVNWVANVCNRFSLKPLTVHVAVQHMDRVLLLSEPEPQLKRFALAAIMLAAKMEESPDAVPIVSELQQVDAGFTSNHLQEMELKIMKFLDWRLQSCTYLHFLNIHINQGVLSSMDMLDGRQVEPKEESYLIKYIFFFADICVLEADFLCLGPGLTSAAIIAAARHTVGVEPVWPADLNIKTGHSANEIRDSVARVMDIFCRDFPASVPPAARVRVCDLGSPTTVDISAQGGTPNAMFGGGVSRINGMSSVDAKMELFPEERIDL